jgi:hypothetical protein
MTQSKKRQPYSTIKCAGCGRSLDLRTYSGYPTDKTDPSHVHVIDNPGAPPVSVFCTCGHYTMYKNLSRPKA